MKELLLFVEIFQSGVAVLVAGAMLVLCVYLYRRDSKTKRWPKVNVHIIESAPAESDSKNQVGSQVFYRAHVVYEYEVDGKTYTCDQIRLAAVSSRYKTDVQKVIDRYPLGSEVEAHVDPQDPANAILDVSLNTFVQIVFVITIITSLLVLLGLVFTVLFDTVIPFILDLVIRSARQ